jgi:hypothetical protein
MDQETCLSNLVEDYLDLETLVLRVKGDVLSMDEFCQILVRQNYILAAIQAQDAGNRYIPISYKVMTYEQYEELELQIADLMKLDYDHEDLQLSYNRSSKTIATFLLHVGPELHCGINVFHLIPDLTTSPPTPKEYRLEIPEKIGTAFPTKTSLSTIVVKGQWSTVDDYSFNSGFIRKVSQVEWNTFVDQYTEMSSKYSPVRCFDGNIDIDLNHIAFEVIVDPSVIKSLEDAVLSPQTLSVGCNLIQLFNECIGYMRQSIRYEQEYKEECEREIASEMDGETFDLMLRGGYNELDSSNEHSVDDWNGDSHTDYE